MGVAESTLRETEQAPGLKSPVPLSKKTPQPSLSQPTIQTSFPTTRQRLHQHASPRSSPKQGSNANGHSTSSPTSPRTKIKLLKGVVCGAPNVGKSCLIHRLRGEDVLGKKNKRRMMALIPWTCDFHRLPVPLEESPRGVQLHVAERNVDDEDINEKGNNHPINSKSASNSNSRKRKEGDVDFVILIIDRTNRESFDYASKWMDNNILKLQHQEDSSSSSKSLSVPSICILLNRYDDGINNKDSSMITMEEIQDMVEEKKKKASESHESLLQIRCFDSCMINGYGLESLNYFITIPYLKKRQKELLLELDRVDRNLKGFDEKMNQENFISFETIQEEYLKNARTQIVVVETKEESQDGDGARQQGNVAIKSSLSTPHILSSDGPRSNEQENKQEKSQTKTEVEMHPQKGRRKIMPTSGDAKKKTGMDQNNSANPEEITNTSESIKKFDKDSTQTQQGRGRRRRGRGKTSDDWKDTMRPPSPQEILKSDKSNNSRTKANEKKTQKKKGKKSERKTKPKHVRYMDPKQALEAFLASDDDDSTDEGGANTAYPSRYKGGMVSITQSSRNKAVLDSDSDDSSDDSDGPFRHNRINRINSASEGLVESELSIPHKKVYYEEKSSAEEGNESDDDSGTMVDSTAGVILERKDESSTDEGQSYHESQIPIGSRVQEDSTSDEEDAIYSGKSKIKGMHENDQMDSDKFEESPDIEESDSVKEDLDRDSCGNVVVAGDSETLPVTTEQKEESSAEACHPHDKSEIISTGSEGQEASVSDLDEDSILSDRKEEESYENEERNPEKPENELDSVPQDENDSYGNSIVSGDVKTHIGDTCEIKVQISDGDAKCNAESESKEQNQDEADVDVEIDQNNEETIADVMDVPQFQETQSDSEKKEMGTYPCDSDIYNSDDDSQQGSYPKLEEDVANTTKHILVNSSEKTQRNESAKTLDRCDNGVERSHLGEIVTVEDSEGLDNSIESSLRAKIALNEHSSTTKSVPLSGAEDTEVSKENDYASPKGVTPCTNESVDHSDYDSDDSSGLIIVDTPQQSSSLQSLNHKILKRSRVKESKKYLTDGEKRTEEQKHQESSISKEVLDAIVAAEKEAMNLASQKKKSKKAKKKSNKKDKKSDSQKKRKKKHS